MRARGWDLLLLHVLWGGGAHTFSKVVAIVAFCKCTRALSFENFFLSQVLLGFGTSCMVHKFSKSTLSSKFL